MTVQPAEARATTAELPSRDTLLELYGQLLKIRRFEERTAELFQTGQVKGTAHSCIGQEAVAVGIGSVLRPDDYLAGHHRSHGHVIAKGGDVNLMMAELLGKRSGYCKGLGGSMHIADLSLGILGCNGIVGAGLSLGCGSALTSVVQGNDRVTVVVFGDGASNEGLFHEALNYASVWKLPVVFVCENNQFALTTTWRDSRAVEDVAIRAAGYAMPGEIVDGNDVLAVREVVGRYVAAARGGNGPALVEAKTYRRLEHSMRANLPSNRDLDQQREWETRDPITRFEQVLASAGVGEAELTEVQRSVEAEIVAAVEFGMAGEPASPDDLRTAAYAPHVTSYPTPKPSERKLTMVGALREALHQEMEAEERVILLGEDVRMGGIFRVSEGLLERFGRKRVWDTPIAEAGYAGIAVGAAMTGLRPVIEIQIFDFVTLTMDAIVNQAAKLRFMMGGGPTIPLVVRGPAGGGIRLAAQHSQTLEAWFAHIPGLVVVAPSNPYDAKGLLAAAIRDDNPVIFLETKSILQEEGPVPEEAYAIPIGVADVKREGTDATVIATQAMVGQALQAARQLEREGVSLEVVDPRSLYPLDVETLAASVRKTNRAVVAHEAPAFGGIGAEIAARVTEQAFDYLDAPIARVGAPHHPIPYEDALERQTIPSWRSIADAVRALL